MASAIPRSHNICCISCRSPRGGDGDRRPRRNATGPARAAPHDGARGTMARIIGDWRRPLVATGPDTSLKTIWARMFPLLSTPGADQYPVTRDIHNVQISNTGGFNVYSLGTGKLLGSTTSLHLNFASALHPGSDGRGDANTLAGTPQHHAHD